MGQQKHEQKEVKKAFNLVRKHTRSSKNQEADSGAQYARSGSQNTESRIARKRRHSSGSDSIGRDTRRRSEQKHAWLQPRPVVGVADSDTHAPSATPHFNKRSKTAESGHVKSKWTPVYRHQLAAYGYLGNFLKSVGILHASTESLEGFELDTSEIVAKEATWSEGLRHNEILLHVPEGVAKESCSIFAVHGLDYDPSGKDERAILETAARAPRNEDKENSLTVVVYYNKEGKATKVSAGFLGHQLPNEVNRPVVEVRGLPPEFVKTLINKLASNKGPWIIS